MVQVSVNVVYINEETNMIEVTQRNTKGNEQSLGIFTEDEFSEYFWHNDILESFANSNIEIRRDKKYIFDYTLLITVPIFAKVAYNEKGKLLTVDYLLGLARKRAYKNRYRSKYNSWSKKRNNYGNSLRRMRTTQERRWANAWDDEEFAPKVRGRRGASSLPNHWDDYHRYNQRNWKKFRKNQWKYYEC